MRSLMAGILGVVVAASLAGCATTEPSFEPTGAMPVTKPNVSSTTPAEGTVARVDPPQQVVVLDNGQMYRVVGDQAVMVNGQPVLINSVQPGNRVTVVGTPVVYQNGQYVTLPSGTVVAAVPAAAPRADVRPGHGHRGQRERQGAPHGRQRARVPSAVRHHRAQGRSGRDRLYVRHDAVGVTPLSLPPRRPGDASLPWSSRRAKPAQRRTGSRGYFENRGSLALS